MNKYIHLLGYVITPCLRRMLVSHVKGVHISICAGPAPTFCHGFGLFDVAHLHFTASLIAGGLTARLSSTVEPSLAFGG